MKVDLMDEHVITPRKDVHIAIRHMTPYDMMDDNVRSEYDYIQRQIRRREITPDEGTLEDIMWLETYYDFGHFVSCYKPGWHHCSNCGCYRLCFANIATLTFTCLKCKLEEEVFNRVNEGKCFDRPIVQQYLNEGKVDPAIEWKSYREIFEEEAKRIQEWYQAQLNSPIFPLSDIDKKNIIEKMINAANISTP